MFLSSLLDPLAERFLRRAQSELDLVPQPVDAPRRVVAGLDSDRVLLVGNGHVIGFGVRTHELAMTGQLARRLAARTGRGTVVDVDARRGLRLERMPEALQSSRLTMYDAVVISVGATDAASLVPMRRWRSGVVRLLDAVQAQVSQGTAVVLLPIRPMQRAGIGDGLGLRLAQAHADRLDRATAEIVAARRGVVMLDADRRVEAARTPEDHLRFADRVIDVLVERLDGQAASLSSTSARARRRGPDPEVLRQAAVDRSGLVGTGSNSLLDRLLQQARDQFGAAIATVTLVDGDRVVLKAAAGTDLAFVERSIAPCNRTIRQDGPYVVGDLAGEPIAEHGTRFYAGHPLESPDGFRIGTLCILDDEPRAEDFDRVALVELAARVQAELWRQIQEGPDSEPTSRIDTGSLRLPALARD